MAKRKFNLRGLLAHDKFDAKCGLILTLICALVGLYQVLGPNKITVNVKLTPNDLGASAAPLPPQTKSQDSPKDSAASPQAHGPKANQTLGAATGAPFPPNKMDNRAAEKPMQSKRIEGTKLPPLVATGGSKHLPPKHYGHIVRQDRPQNNCKCDVGGREGSSGEDDNSTDDEVTYAQGDNSGSININVVNSDSSSVTVIAGGS